MRSNTRLHTYIYAHPKRHKAYCTCSDGYQCSGYGYHHSDSNPDGGNSYGSGSYIISNSDRTGGETRYYIQLPDGLLRHPGS